LCAPESVKIGRELLHNFHLAELSGYGDHSL